MKLLLVLSLFFVLPSCEEGKKRAKAKTSGAEKAEKPDDKEKKSLLNVPAGAVVEDLVLPYLDDDENKVSLLTIKQLTVVDDPRTGKTILKGENLKLWFFDDAGEIRSTTTIPSADYLVDEERLIAKGELRMITSDRKFATIANGGVFSLATGQALLLGPTITHLTIPEKESKTSP